MKTLNQEDLVLKIRDFLSNINIRSKKNLVQSPLLLHVAFIRDSAADYNEWKHSTEQTIKNSQTNFNFGAYMCIHVFMLLLLNHLTFDLPTQWYVIYSSSFYSVLLWC